MWLRAARGAIQTLMGRYSADMASTTIKVSTDTRDRIRSYGGETYEETIVAALDAFDAPGFWAQAQRAADWRQSLSATQRATLKAREAEIDRAFDGLG